MQSAVRHLHASVTVRCLDVCNAYIHAYKHTHIQTYIGGGVFTYATPAFRV
jgi:hypothetical protein